MARLHLDAGHELLEELVGHIVEGLHIIPALFVEGRRVLGEVDGREELANGRRHAGL